MSEFGLVLVTGITIAVMLGGFVALALASILEEQQREKRRRR